MSISNCTVLAQKYNRKLLSLLGSVLLKVSEMWALVSLELLLQRSLERERVEEVGLLAIKLVIRLVVGTSFQLGSLSARTILGPGIGKTV